MIVDKELLKTVLVTDCGSTTTKALLFEKTAEGWRQTFRGEAPTTVEQPVADVTVGAMNAFREIEELSGKKIIKDESNTQPFNISTNGIDLYLSTSSAGGGLQMVVGGLVSSMTTESAERAALGAGAIVMAAISADDGREDHERIEKIRHLRPDIMLITGGVDGGAKTHVLELAEILKAANPRPRFGQTLKMPVIYAGNKDAAEEVAQILGEKTQVYVVDNVRPSLDTENLGPAREAIHELFLTHVMSHSPGYDKLLSWSPKPVIPTPSAVGKMVENYARSQNLNVLCADIGGATTDIFSVFKNREGEAIFNRTVSANLGMSYSVANVLKEAGVDNIKRWLPYEISATEVRDRLRNKMIRPTTIPQTKEDLWLEQGVCREALRLSLAHHRALAVGLSGVKQKRGIADIFSQKKARYELVDMMKLDLVIGSGGVLSHAPDRLTAALMMIDGFGLQGLTQIAVDSIFMLPHLGVFSETCLEAAEEIFLRDCLVNIGHAVVPVGEGKEKIGEGIVKVFIDDEKVSDLKKGEVSLFKLSQKECELKLEPASQYNVGAGGGKIVIKKIIPGISGLILDGRSRESREINSESQAQILSSLGVSL